MRNIPYNLEAEQAVLGCVLLENNLLRNIADEVDVKDFHDIKNQHIFNAMKNLYRQQMVIDYTTLLTELQNKNLLNEAGGIQYLHTILNCIFTTANVEDYLVIIKDTALKRSVISAANAIVDAGFDPLWDSTQYIDYAQASINDLASRRKTDGFVDIGRVVDNVTSITMENMTRKEGITGLNTGFDNLDQLTSGLQNGNLIIIAARPAMGKSAFAMNIATFVSKYNVSKKDQTSPAHVAVFSLEMSSEQIVERMCAAESRIPLDNIRKGSLNAQELARFEHAGNNLRALNLHFSDQATVTIADIRAKCRKQRDTEGLDLVVIDYLQLISGDPKSKSSRQEEVSIISRGLKQMARELEVPVIALSQLSREVEKRDDKRPVMADIRESGSIEQDADIIFFIYRDEYYNKYKSEKIGIAELIVAKNRSGASGDSLEYKFLGQNSLFVSIVKEEESGFGND